MTLLQAFILGLLQGVTEFLPISSSGHLVLAEGIFGLKVEDLKAFDVALHLGSLLAIITYFWKDIIGLFRNWKLVGYLVLATLPAVAVGLTLEDRIDGLFRDPKAVISMLVVLGAFFLVAERFPRDKTRWRFNLKNTFVMGLAQSVALIPGISRSGSVIGTGLLFGLKREEAARFAFLLGIPAIAGASLLTGIKVFQGETPLPTWDLVLVGFVTSAVVGYLSVALLMKFLKTHSLRAFTVYLWLASLVGWWLMN